MISVEIEKEINQENKIIGNLNLRQLCCIGAGAVFAGIVIFGLKMSPDLAIYPCGIFGVICGAFGWYKQNGLPLEKVCFKKVQEFMYNSNTRKYKTKNQYITLLNDEYNRRKNIDLSNKKIAKQIKREEKKNLKKIKKTNKRSKIKTIN